MATEIGKNLPPSEGGNTAKSASNHAMPTVLGDALQMLIENRLLKVTREAQGLGADTGEEVGVDVGWERMPGAAKEFYGQSADSATDEEETE